MNLDRLLERARQGDADAIARLISRSLGGKGVVASATWQSDQRLDILLESEQLLDRAVVVPLIRRGFLRLEMGCSIASVHLTSRRLGQDFPDWQETFHLPAPTARPSAPLSRPPSPSPQPPNPRPLSDTALAALAHLAPLFAYLIWLVNFWGDFPLFWGGTFLLPWRVVLPLALLLVQGNEDPTFKASLQEALNFQLSMLVYWVMTLFSMLLLIGFLLALPLALFELICIVMGAVNASAGKPFRYPLTLRFVR